MNDGEAAARAVGPKTAMRFQTGKHLKVGHCGLSVSGERRQMAASRKCVHVCMCVGRTLRRCFWHTSSASTLRCDLAATHANAMR